MVLFFRHIPFVVNHTFNATSPERLQQNQCMPLYRVFREMWLKTIVLLRIFAEFVNKSP